MSLHINSVIMTHALNNFVVNCSDSELSDLLNGVDEIDPCIAARSDLSWCFHAYRMLLKRGNLPVFCSNRLIRDAVNIVHATQLSDINGDPSFFSVCVQGDYPDEHDAHFFIVQNLNQLSVNKYYMPHWVQPGIIKRSFLRHGVHSVAYVGPNEVEIPMNYEQKLNQFLEPYHIRVVSLVGKLWYDFSNVDVLIGIRSFDNNPHNTKPPSRLFTAWHAGIPFIGGCDSAYTQVGRPGMDYLQVDSLEMAAKAVMLLKDDKWLYSRLVTNGSSKAWQYSNENIARLWEYVLAGPVRRRYRLWEKEICYE